MHKLTDPTHISGAVADTTISDRSSTYLGASLSGASATLIVYHGAVADAVIIDYLQTGAGGETVVSSYSNGLKKQCTNGIHTATTGAGAKAIVQKTVS